MLCFTLFFFFFNDTATTEIYTLSLHDALPSPVFPQAYDFERAPPDTQGVVPGTYFVRAFLDSLTNGVRDPGEAAGQFGGATPTAVGVAEGDMQAGRDFVLADPALGSADLF